MEIVKKKDEMRRVSKELKSQGKRIGFVPTMGYLHLGHLSLVRASVVRTQATVVSVFVNPAQFGPQEDFKEYPRDLNRDAEILKREGVEMVFAPEAEEMYPPGYKTYVEVQELQDKLCGRSRPGHFRGVCTVVLKLFHIVQPDVAFFGQKDAQQAIVLKKMVRDLDLEVNIEVLPTVREEDGLAISSRNTYLNPEQRKAALCLYRSLGEAQQMIKKGERDSGKIIEKMKEIIKAEPLARIDYVEIVDAEELNPLAHLEKDALIALAVYVDKVRLIDNAMVHLKE
ncbi:MAG: pantoate--beta-alanine ligase [Candidatus Aminicenantes bacterium]